MPMTYLMLMIVFECYLLFWNDQSIYFSTLVLCYFYPIFLCLCFSWMLETEMEELDTAQWDCID